MNIDSLVTKERADKYRLIEKIGDGESGCVWSATDTETRDIVALKFYRRNDRNAAGKARHEHEMSRIAQSPHILQAIGFTTIEGTPCIILPYCRQRSADALAGYFSECMLWRFISDVASGLAALHEKGYMHLDIKPSNILINDDRFIISDFGGCRSTTQANTETENIEEDKSSYSYSAPEWSKSGERLTSASDIWSLGASAFMLLMSTPIFSGQGGKKQLIDTPLPSFRRDRYSEALSLLIKRCLDYTPALRPTAREIIDIATRRLNEIATQQPQSRTKKANTVSVTNSSLSDSNQYMKQF